MFKFMISNQAITWPAAPEVRRQKSESRITVVFVFLILLSLFSPFRIWAAEDLSLQDRLYDNYGIDLYGFWEVRNGWRLDRDADEKDASIAETRLQLDLGKDLGWGILKIKGDFLGDLVEEETRAILRECNLQFSPSDSIDVKLGRQTLTWGTGDLLFINDLFPKDWTSFFIGRDSEYLKAPSDAVKASLFFDFVNVDLAYVPIFNNSEYIDGSRLSYWNSMLGRTAGRDFVFGDHERNRFGNDSEYAIRASKNVNGKEIALYGYAGFWKTPEGLNPQTAKLFYPELSAYGLSIRQPVFGGIGNVEAGYYDSRDDRDGNDPMTRNSEIRFLAGYERELGRDFTGAFQYYLEFMQDYDQYRRVLPPGMRKADEYRHLFTVRLTKLLMNQNLKLSLFAYYSPSDEDCYLRPNIHYKINDQWAVEGGGNIFAGADDHTFFGQFEDNTNLYAGLRWSF